MIYFIYKTTNLVNGKYYIGKHQTKNLETDTYLGSGVGLLKAIKKHGRESFKREILCFCESLQELNSKEIELLTEREVADSNCYNQRIGGEGGWSHWLNGEAARESRSRGGKNSGTRERNLSRTLDENISLYHKTLGKWCQNNPELIGKQTPESLKIKSEKMKGVGNPNHGLLRKTIIKDNITKKVLYDEAEQYINDGWKLVKRVRKQNHSTSGTCWIFKNGENKLINKNDLDKYLLLGYSKGRIVNKRL